MANTSLRIKKAAAAVLAAASVAVIGIGLLHTPAARKFPIARRLLGAMGVRCPLDQVPLPPARAEAARGRAISRLRGLSPAPARPSLAGLELDATTSEQAWSWARSLGLQCALQKRGMRTLRCMRGTSGKSTASAPAQTLSLSFNSSDLLVSVDVFRRRLAAREASVLMRDLRQRLSRSLGRPSETRGSLTPGYLAGGLEMRTAVVDYRFRNYLALLTATHIPWSGGVTLHEQYLSAAASSYRTLLMQGRTSRASALEGPPRGP